jgi:hypothetical protein
VMQSDASVSGNLVYVLQALILFSIAANFLRSFKLQLPTVGRRPAGDPLSATGIPTVNPAAADKDIE